MRAARASWMIFGLVVLACVTAEARAATSPPAASTAPAHAKPVMAPAYASAPQPWQDFLLKARAADDIADPLQRCLAYPVLPGTHWPTGLIEAHCEYTFGKMPDRKEIFSRIDAGDVDWLDRTFRQYLDRHFSESDFSEHIHNLFDQFGGDYESGRASQRWLQLAPDSAFAMTARAAFYKSLGWQARGSAFMADTPPEQVAQMTAHHAKAVALYQQAIAREPRMLPAYAGLVDLGKNDDALGTLAFEAGMKIDPACKVLLSERMSALLPRWGGSYDQMLALEQRMLPYLDKRPLLSLSRVWPYVDMAEGLADDKRYTEAAAALRPILALSSSPQVQEDFFLDYAKAQYSEAWATLAYGVAPKRFRLGSASVASYRGYLELTVAYDNALAARDYADAVALEPGFAGYHLYYGTALARSGKFADAEREYGLAMKFDPKKEQTYQDAMTALGRLLIDASEYKRALDLSERAIAEFPKNAMSWYLRAAALRRTGASLARQREALLKGLRVVDRTSVQARAMEADLKALDDEAKVAK